VGGIGLLINGVDGAAQLAAINDVRCAAIERRMYEASPPRDDLPDIFAALQCRPQTNLHVALPR